MIRQAESLPGLAEFSSAVRARFAKVFRIHESSFAARSVSIGFGLAANVSLVVFAWTLGWIVDAAGSDASGLLFRGAPPFRVEWLGSIAALVLSSGIALLMGWGSSVFRVFRSEGLARIAAGSRPSFRSNISPEIYVPSFEETFSGRSSLMFGLLLATVSAFGSFASVEWLLSAALFVAGGVFFPEIHAKEVEPGRFFSSGFLFAAWRAGVPVQSAPNGSVGMGAHRHWLVRAIVFLLLAAAFARASGSGLELFSAGRISAGESVQSLACLVLSFSWLAFALFVLPASRPDSAASLSRASGAGLVGDVVLARRGQPDRSVERGSAIAFFVVGRDVDASAWLFNMLFSSSPDGASPANPVRFEKPQGSGGAPAGCVPCPLTDSMADPLKRLSEWAGIPMDRFCDLNGQFDADCDGVDTNASSVWRWSVLAERLRCGAEAPMVLVGLPDEGSSEDAADLVSAARTKDGWVLCAPPNIGWAPLFDMVCLVSDGEILVSGTHAQLLSSSSFWRENWKIWVSSFHAAIRGNDG